MMTGSNAAQIYSEPNMNRDNVLLFIPAYNCAEQISRVLSTLPERLPHCISEIIIVNNRSKDSTEDRIQHYIKSLPANGRRTIRYLLNNENYGLGGSHKVAYQYALANGFDGVVTLHGDDQANLQDFKRHLDDWSTGKLEADAILGSRFSLGSRIKGYALHRTGGNYLLNFLWCLLLWRVIPDIGSGLNFISSEAIRKLDLARLPDSLVFNPQQLLQLVNADVRMKFVPIEWKEEDQQSNAIPWKIFMMSLKQVVNYRLGIRPPKAERDLGNYTFQVISSSKLA